LHGSLSVLDRRVEIGRPRHAVTRGKHRRHTGVGRSGSQRATALATPIRHDRPAGPGPHPQPETVHAGTAPVIRLEGPLALCHDSLLAASGIVLDTVSHAGGSRSPPRCLDRLCVSLVTGAASGLDARIAAVSPTFGRLYEGTDRCSRGQTTLGRRPDRHQTLTAVTPATGPRSNLCQGVPNVAERLARTRKTVSFGRCCFIPKRRRTTKQGWQIGLLASWISLAVSSADPASRQR
jgi:hypothetical protein